MVALHLPSSSFSLLLGRRTFDLGVRLAQDYRVATELLAILPPSPSLSSKLKTGVPSGILERGSTLPKEGSASGPTMTLWPT
jgi:hypothetical protein